MGYFGHPLFAVICLLSLVACNFLAFYSNLWLSIWVEAYDRNAHMDVLYYMGIYTLITFSEIFMYGVALILFQWGSWRAARRLHHEFISAVMRVSLSWFKIIPIGRITNRFSGDMTSIDNSVGELVRTFLDVVAQMIFRIVAVSSIMPIFMLPSLFACVFGIGIGELYTRTAVVIKRLMSSAQSPIFSQFGDTLAGLAIIRSRAGMSKTFVEGMAAKARAWSVSAEASFNLNRWVAVRVDFVTAWIALCAGIIAVNKAGVIGAGLVGFSLSNANALSQTILWLIRAMNDLEVEMQSVSPVTLSWRFDLADCFLQFHRVREYIKVEPEEKDDTVYPEEGQYADASDHVIPHNWPSTGEVEFRDVTIRYDLDGPDILTNVNLTFKAGERVAVVGRTGSGKSTVTTPTANSSVLHVTDFRSSSSRCLGLRTLYQAKSFTMGSTSQRLPDGGCERA
jgi:ABC-type multidrug transport system fused ATPase/permease subunit